MKQLIAALVLVTLIATPHTVIAEIPSSYTNDNIFTAEHDRPVSLFMDGAGGFYGFTETGFRFTQQPVTNAFGVRLHKFSIDQAFFYVSDQGIIEANDDLAAVSIYLSRNQG